jgi:hypothetical protein
MAAKWEEKKMAAITFWTLFPSVSSVSVARKRDERGSPAGLIF